MKKRFWLSDWFLALSVSLLVLLSSQSAVLQGFERTAYDWGLRGAHATPNPDIAIIAIDDESIRRLGRWPWSRSKHAEMLDLLHQAGTKVIGHTVLFPEPQLDPGLLSIREIQQQLNNSSFATAAASIKKDTELSELLQTDFEALTTLVSDAESQLDTDTTLANSLALAGSVVLASQFAEFGQPRGNSPQLPDFAQASVITRVSDKIGALGDGLLPLSAIRPLFPISSLGDYAAGLGHLTFALDTDGGVRSTPLVLNHYDVFYPAMSLILAAKSLNLEVNDIHVLLGQGVELGDLQIRTDSRLLMNNFFYGEQPDGQPAFRVDSFVDVLDGKIPLELFRNKTVLIGATASGIGDQQVTPISSSMAPVFTLAHSVSSLLNEDFFVEPEWGVMARLGTFLFIALYLMFLMPRLAAGIAALLSTMLLIGLLATHYVLMTNEFLWVQLMLPAFLLVCGHALLTTKRFLATERGKQHSDRESAESNKMLGLSFQSQGQLDMAFEKFRKVPLDDGFLETLYNLGLDFERKRQFNKASSVYGHIAKQNTKFKDISSRMQRANAMQDTVILGGAGGGGNESTLVLDANSGFEKPKLGRYEVEKELGKGAMGTVYLGKDPKISRVVAIKTMALSQEFEPDELEDVKQRFFREAETAGRLSHPNIVTIFDAGEEHDLAYIAMEFLKGKDLAGFTKPGQLLPLGKVLSIVERAAEALHYAHKQSVVHRDIKPANLMYELEADELKLTDFGIARITDSSKTKTGMVLGTPSYMSPEQLAGRKVDGRSDLFSLGVMLYQMTTGKLPFTADSMATLMYKIANEPHTDLSTLETQLPAELVAVINKSLQKDVNDRYQTGAEMAAAVRQCLDHSTGAGI